MNPALSWELAYQEWTYVTRKLRSEPLSTAGLDQAPQGETQELQLLEKLLSCL